MSVSSIAKHAEKLIADNSPAILTIVAVTGTLTTAFLTGKATFKAAEVIEHEKERLAIYKNSRHIEFKDEFKLVWKLYIPSAGSCLMTIVCVVGANRIGSRRAAAVAAAFSISEKAIAEYKDKVIERVGDVKEQKIRDEIAQDHVDRDPVGGREVIITGNGEVLCYDQFSGRYFKSAYETLKKAQNDINYKLISDDYASLSDFYDKIGLAPTAYSEEVGWRVETKLELEFSACLSEDQRPCISIGFHIAPVRDYYRVN